MSLFKVILLNSILALSLTSFAENSSTSKKDHILFGPTNILFELCSTITIDLLERGYTRIEEYSPMMSHLELLYIYKFSKKIHIAPEEILQIDDQKKESQDNPKKTKHIAPTYDKVFELVTIRYFINKSGKEDINCLSQTYKPSN